MSKPFGVNPMQARINTIQIQKRIGGIDSLLKTATNIQNAKSGEYKPNREQRRFANKQQNKS